MPMSAALQKAMNDQIRKEFSASYLYLAMAAWCAERNFDGFAKWMRIQADEERSHAMRIYDFLLDRGGHVALGEVAEPAVKWKTVFEVFDAARRHEQMVSSSINALYARGVQEKDYPSQIMLQWFINEQVEEEKTSTAVVERLRLVGESVPGLLLLDRQMGERSRE